tara:strand:- start:103 stop:336 length:234 start_codon:yes stop_codon:yes gene_type:complete
MIKYIRLCILSCCIAFIFLSPAYAYLDPGTISIVLQSILAAIAGIAATYKLWIFKLKNFLGKIKKKIKIKNNNIKET